MQRFLAHELLRTFWESPSDTMNKEDLHKIHEEREVIEKWRKISRHVVCRLLLDKKECGAVRERDCMVRCQLCEDVYLCAEACVRRHSCHFHPMVSFRTW